MPDVPYITVDKIKLVDDCVSLLGDSVEIVTISLRNRSYIVEIREVSDQQIQELADPGQE